MSSHIVGSSPSWERLNELSQKRLESLRGPPGPHDTSRSAGPGCGSGPLRASEIDEEWQAMVDADPMAVAELPDESRFRARLRRSGRLVDGQLDLAIDLDGALIGRIQTFVPPAGRCPRGPST